MQTYMHYELYDDILTTLAKDFFFKQPLHDTRTEMTEIKSENGNKKDASTKKRQNFNMLIA